MNFTLKQLSDHLFCYADTCNVYIIRCGHAAVVIDFGSGAVLDVLPSLGIHRVSAILMTHHHRDQGQGLPLACEQGIRVYVPQTEQDLFAQMDEHWQARQIYNNYDVRQDRFSLLDSIPVAGTLDDYADYTFSGCTFTVIPTPGHTVGSITLMARIDGQRVAFVGDLIYAPGKIWSLAASQWTYNGGEGLPAMVASMLYLCQHELSLLLPSHGQPMDNPAEAMQLTITPLMELMTHRRQNLRLMQLIQQPYVAVTPHLLWCRASMSNYYVLRSESGKALLIDFGYDMMTGHPSSSARESRRPWLYNIPVLKRESGITQLEAVLPTHYHDDHVAGINLLRRVEGTQVWAAENYADILQRPAHYDLPCQWYDPIPVDRVIGLEQPFRWEEYTLTLYPLGGHTLHAVAVAFEADGKRILVTGDQYQNGDHYNYVYQNRYQLGDHIRSADLYARLNPDVILTGHWDPLWTPPGYFDLLRERGEAVERLHQTLLPLEEVDFDAEGVGAWVRPYQSEVEPWSLISFEVDVRNPLPTEETLRVSLVVPEGWKVNQPVQQMRLPPLSTGCLEFQVQVDDHPVRRARIAADLTVGTRRFGQHAEALVTVKPSI
jgi:glyoxylase-like metal-dependent hydrolase (beta-lactamase superfamily II)